MLFLTISIVLFIVFLGFLIWALGNLIDGELHIALILAIVAIVAFVGGYWFKTHHIVPTQYIGVSKDTFSQTLAGPYRAGIMPKPFFSSIYNYPASTDYERCETYTPAIKGSYGITVDLCLYYDASSVDWVAEIGRTGSLDSDYIMGVWRNSIVSAVARSVKDYTPEELSDKRAEVEQALFGNVSPWFTERGVPLVRVSFKNWDFTSEAVAKSFDESIVSQRKITEQTALFEAAKISRERETYEADTALIVAERQKESLSLLGLEGDAAVQYLWIKALTESDLQVDVLILGASNTPVSVPAPR